MADAIDPHSEPTRGAPPAAPDGAQSGPPGGSPVVGPGKHEAPSAGGAPATPGEHPKPPHPWRKRSLLLAVVGGLAYGGYALYPAILTAMNTISTDDAYVDGHVTFVAPRVAGEVLAVLVDDNMRVKKGSILVQLDKEPYQIKLAIKQAAVTASEADLAAARAQVRGLVATIRARRFALERAIEDVNTNTANLRANVATLKSKKATLELARANLKRGDELLPSGGISKEELETRRETVAVDEAAVDQALQSVYASRVGLGLPIEPPPGKDLGDVPPTLIDTFSAVSQAAGTLLESLAELGYSPSSWDITPREGRAEFLKQDPSASVDQIYAKLMTNAPAIKQAEAKLAAAKRDLDQAELDLRYTDVVAEIDGVITRRNVNRGNNVQAAQNLMAIRSLTEIWINANFKETQLAELRIGQRVRCEVDMYGTIREFEGRITGFTMGTGQTLSLLPPQNATGNFVKIVQRLPVRVELSNYKPDEAPLFVGLSVVPYVYYKEPAEGPHAGEYLQPLLPLPQGTTVKDATSQTDPASRSAPPPKAQKG
jgi:membrane fusion protein (multidrug efflux system)